MLRKEHSDLLTTTGPDTPMGRLFRSYWMPALLSEELPENDCPPVRVKLLSERLLAFRDTDGRYGLVDEFCAHRGVSLWFGRNEECGLRCVYHGWKYDVTGQCIDVPSEPDASGFAKKVKLRSYPLVERGGVLWTYMGPPETQPPLPEWEFITVPRAQTFTTKRVQESNWLQAMEGGIDSSHVSFLHRGDLDSDPLFKGAQWVMPSFTMIAPRGHHSVHGHFWIPIDDDNCWAWSFDYHPIRELTQAELAAMRDGKGIHVRFDPATYRPLANKDNDYLIDRAAQKAGRTFSGVEGIGMQDAALQESMGPIVDRTKENLVSTDNGIIMARHRLLRAVKALVDKGVVPPGVYPAHQKVRSAAIVLPPDVPFTEGAREALIAQPSVAPASV
jgi:phthalate 4,5-dioxygenase oxygenase subunit